MFDAFITSRLYSPSDEDVTFFDESIDAKLNRYKLRVKKVRRGEAAMRRAQRNSDIASS